jgi:hypothetical protein
MGLRFVTSESAFDYFRATKDTPGDARQAGSDKHGIFRVNAKDAIGGDRVTQFGRVLSELNIDIICANSPQAKGRVERAFGTLQDRLVKGVAAAIAAPTALTPKRPSTCIPLHCIQSRLLPEEILYGRPIPTNQGRLARTLTETRTIRRTPRLDRSASIASSPAVGDVLLGDANCIKSLGDIALRRSDHAAARTALRELTAAPRYGLLPRTNRTIG